MNDKQRTDIIARLEAITPFLVALQGESDATEEISEKPPQWTFEIIVTPANAANAEFLNAAPDDIRALLDDNDALRARVAELESALFEWNLLVKMSGSKVQDDTRRLTDESEATE